MALEVIWTDEANDNLDEIIEYLEKNWANKEIHDFFTRLDESIEAIRKNPGSYKNSVRKSGVKEFQHSKQTTIFYTYDDNAVYVLLLWINKKDFRNLD